jgi:segregation and condensation protein A
MCVTFKDVAAVLSARFQAANRFVPRISGIDQRLVTPAPEVVLPVDPAGLRHIARRVVAGADTEPDLDHLDLDLPSVQAAVDELRARVAEVAETTFEDLVAHCTRRVEIAAYFLALLELARWGMVRLAQDDWLSSIDVRHAPGGGGPMVSEWT